MKIIGFVGEDGTAALGVQLADSRRPDRPMRHHIQGRPHQAEPAECIAATHSEVADADALFFADTGIRVEDPASA